jgi:hypothetical protein
MRTIYGFIYFVRENAKIVIAEHESSTTLLLENLPVSVSAGNRNGKGVKSVKEE